jgi:tetratricopeptide (TPR) repeat protein
MSRVGLILLPLILGITQPCVAAPGAASPGKPSATATENLVVPTAEDRLKRLEQELRDEQRERDIAIIHADLIDRQTSWFENLISALIAFFSLLVTVLLLYFGWRFGKEAVNAAKLEVAEYRPQMDQQVAAVQALAEKVQAIADESEANLEAMRGHEQTAQQIVAKLAPSEAPTDAGDRQTLRDIARDALAKPRRERTVDEYRALVMVAMLDEDWESMERRAGAMAYMFDDADPESLAFASFRRAHALNEQGRRSDELAALADFIARFGDNPMPALQEQVASALYNKGVTLGQLDRPEDALAAYDEVLARFGDSALPALQEQVANALFNKGGTLGKLDRPEDALAAYDAVLARFGDNPLPALQERVAMALVNKGVTLGKLDRPEDALAAYDAVLARFGDSPLPALQDCVASALFNKACCFGKMTKVAECIEALTQWRDHLDRFDCDKIVGDTDFDGVRADPQFVAFLADNGCAPPPKAPRARRPRKPST